MRVAQTNRFRKDLHLAKKRGLPLERLSIVIDKLLCGEPLDAKHKDHLLSGEYAGCRECHILPDWLLIYEIGNDVLGLLRTGTHSDLF
ncbi:hypothetical protein FACS1894103_7280 [Campylobacterota bacterium]|nr:hypothetical protein FACS1894103_7280 [Campylobacterota bacterium]